MKITVDITDADAVFISQFLETTKALTRSNGGPLDMAKLAACCSGMLP